MAVTTRLTPAQARVADAMRDGAELHLVLGEAVNPWELRAEGEPVRIVNTKTGNGLLHRRIVVFDRAEHLFGLRHIFRLTPEYRDGEA